jgi:hypothetical protein
MFKVSRMVLVASACLAFMAAVPVSAENPSRPFEKPLKAVQELMTAKKFDEAAVKLRETRAVANPTAYDTFVMNEFGGVIAVNQKKFAEAYDMLAANANSQFLPAKGQRQKALATLAYQLKNYPAAIEHANNCEAQGADDDNTHVIKTQAFYLLGKYREAATGAADLVSRDEKAGRHPDKSSLLLLRQAQEKIGDNTGQSRTLEKLLTYYPNADLWTLAIASLKEQADKSKDDRLLLQVYRLMADVGSLKSAPQYSEMAQLAIEQGFPGEAQRVLDQGMSKGVFAGTTEKDRLEKERNGRIMEMAKKLVATERDSMAKIESLANSAKDGNMLVAAGSSQAFNLDNPAKGATLIAAGISKGSLKSLNDAYITLGAVDAKLKNNAEALKAFDNVDKNEAYERLAKLWSLHVR